MRKVYTWIFLMLTLLLLVIPASAHSGRTDSRGGHNGPGGYHYHHGYPAHDHWDMDGDGDIDCPYDFDNKTGENSGSGGDNSATGGAEPNKTTKADKVADKADDKEDNAILSYLVWIALLSLLLYFAFIVLHERKATKKRLEEEAKREQIRQAENAAILQKLGKSGVEIPKGVQLLPNGTPTRGAVNPSRPYGDYTVYIARKGTRYHLQKKCCKTGLPHHIFEVPMFVTPCKLCAKGSAGGQNVPDWYKIIRQKRR